MAKLVTLLLEPKHSIYDHLTKKRSLLVSRGHGKSTFTEEYTAAQTNTAILTPASGKKLAVVGVLLSTDANTGVISLDFATSAKKVFRLYASAFAESVEDDLHIEGATDEALTLNSTTGTSNVFVLVNYRLVD